MPQAVNVVGQAEQQSLADLGGQAAPGGARGELAFDGGEDAFDLGALPIRFFRKGAEHLIPNGAVGDTPAPRGNDALGSQALPNVLVVGFGIKLRIREHHTDRSAACRRWRQKWAGADGAAADARFLAIRDRRCHPPAAAGNDTAWCSPAPPAIAIRRATLGARAGVLRLRERSSLRSASGTAPPATAAG